MELNQTGIDQQVPKDNPCWTLIQKAESELLVQGYELEALMADIRSLCLTEEETGP